MPSKLKEVLERCSETVPFSGEPISDVNQRGLFDDTPLHVVSTWGEPEAVAVLLEAGADPNARGDRGQTPLFRAVVSRSEKVVRLLLAANADPKILDDLGISAAEYAKNVGAKKIASLIEDGVNVVKAHKPLH